MKLSGHNYSNDVFDSLLDGLSNDVVLKKTAEKKSGPKLDWNFTQTTKETFANVQEEELQFMADELLFAAQNAGVEVTGEDLSSFASTSKSQGLRGKGLERAARKYCSNMERETAPPQGTTRLSSAQLIDQARVGSITPAGYSPEHGPGDNRTGGYMGMSKNPNSIWDSEALTRLAQKPGEHQDQYGDEQIKHSKDVRKEFKEAQKRQEWEQRQDAGTDQLPKAASVANVSTVEKTAGNQNLPSNSMSMFSNDRDFSNIPAETAGEMLKKQAETRSNKAEEDRAAESPAQGAKKADNSGSVFFSEHKAAPQGQTETQRSQMDRLFEGLLGK